LLQLWAHPHGQRLLGPRVRRDDNGLVRPKDI
jgi:hypothetical protein